MPRRQLLGVLVMVPSLVGAAPASDWDAITYSPAMNIERTAVAPLADLEERLTPAGLAAPALALASQNADASLDQSLVFPIPTGWVVDDAGIVPGTLRTELDAKLAAFAVKTTDQLVIVTVKSLG